MNRNAVSVLIQNVIYLIASLAVLCGPFSANAIVSMENIHLGHPQEGFAGLFSLDLALQGGNTEQADVATGVKLQWTHQQIINFILANYEYGESDGVKNKNKGFAHYRHIHQRDAQFAWEGFTQVSSNQFTNLTLRALVGGGVRLTVGERNEKQAFFVGLGAFYEHEKLDTNYPDEADTENALRANTYLVIKYLFNEHVTLVSTTYYQPNASDIADFRAIEDLSLVSKLTEVLSLNVSIDIAHDSQPPRDVKQTDSSLKIGVEVNF